MGLKEQNALLRKANRKLLKESAELLSQRDRYREAYRDELRKRDPSAPPVRKKTARLARTKEAILSRRRGALA
jgi:hypothetical protein